MSNFRETIARGQTETVPSGVVQHNLADIKPTVAEINHLWTTYFAETQSVAFLKHMAAKSKDPDYHSVLRQALDLANSNIKLMEDLYNTIQHPIPEAFGERDVDIDAPPLFDETFSVRYTRLMTKFILQNHGLAFNECTRSDFRNLFSGFIDGSKGVIERADDVLLAKGVFPKSPYIVPPDRVEYVHSKKYHGSFFGKGRPLNVLGISNIFAILDFNTAILALILGFAQVVKSKELRKHFNHGEELIAKQIKVLRSFLENDGLPGPELVNYQVTDSQESPYSDRLMLFHASVVIGYILTGYGVGLSRITRKDVVTTYLQLIAEIIVYSKNGADLLIKNGWIEKIPETANRQELTH